MKLLYIHQYFVTPREPGGNRSYWFARKAIESGHQVTVITGRTAQDRLVCRENVDGIDVVYIRNAYSNQMSYLRRVYSFARFMICSAYMGLRERNVDLVYATSTPLSVGITALVLKWFGRKPFVFEVRDLWPEAPIQLGIVKNGLTKKILRGAERLIYRSASHIVALSPGIKDGILRSGVHVAISVIPNMAKNNYFFPRQRNEKLASHLGIDLDCFNAIYFGTMGFANGLNYVLDAAALLKQRGVNNIHFVFAGEGAMEPQLRTRSRKLQLDSVKFVGAHPMNAITEIVNLCDCSLLIFSNKPVLYTNSPNKLFDSLAAGLPVLVNSNGWTRHIVEDNECGRFVDPAHAHSLADTLIQMRDEKEALYEMRMNSRRVAEREFDADLLSSRFVAVIEQFAFQRQGISA